MDNEKEMLTAFGVFVTVYDPDIFIGHNIVGFDIPYIVTRANYLNIGDAMYMGRRHERRWNNPREITRMRKNGDVRKSLRAETPGRIQLDTLPFIQDAVKESSYRLGYLAQKYLNDGKDDVGYQMIGPLWKQSPATRARLCLYCMKDVMLSLGLAMHKRFEMILSTIELARGTKVRAPQLLRSGNQEKVKTLVLYAAKNPGFDSENLPVFFPYEIPRPRSKDDKFQGATVVNPKRGAHLKNQPVAVGDFSSLYPSIMISNNMCYSTMLDVPRNTPAPDGAPPHHTSPDIGVHFVKKEVRNGLLPRILSDLLQQRAKAKGMIKSDPNPAHKRMYDFRQLQLKKIANSVYGVLSASGGWFVRMEMGESVTAWGRSMINRAINIAVSSPFNADVIYGDTDSIMMVFPGCTTVPDAFERLRNVCNAVTASFPEPVAMAAEKVYEGHLQLGKKRYAGLCHIPPDRPKVDSKGVEKNRLDNCPYLRKIMARVFELLLVDENIGGAVNYVHECVADLFHNRVEYTDLVITKSISKMVYKSKAVHVEVAKRMKKRDSSYLMAPGERIPYVIVRAASNTSRVCDKAEDPLWAIQHNMEIDVEHYIKDLSKPLARVFMWYIAPKDMLLEIKELEQNIATCKDPKHETILKNTLKKRLEKMINHVATQLFGPKVLDKIRRPPPRHVGPMYKFLECKTVQARDTDADAKRLNDLRAQLAKAKAKCVECRGREDDTVACVQRDCETLFKVALLTRDIEEIDRLMQQNSNK